MSAIRQSYHRLRTGNLLHYRYTEADGPVIVLLHPSPMSSRFMAPLMRHLAPLGCVLAPDTPGYGYSDPLPNDDAGLAPYVSVLHEWIAALELAPLVLYGSATGAQIAAEYAKAHPEQVAGLVLDNALHFEVEEREDLLEGYFPDRAVQPDGVHLLGHWCNMRNLSRYFPWHRESEATALPAPAAPLDAVQEQLVDQLLAGAGYARAYRAAFENEHLSNLVKVSVPTQVICWQGSPVYRWMKPILEHGPWGEHVRISDCGPGLDERYALIFDACQGMARKLPARTVQRPDFAREMDRQGVAVSYGDGGGASEEGENPALHWYGFKHSGESRRIVLLLHDLGASAIGQFGPLLKDGGAGCYAVDLPGHGRSGAQGGIDLSGTASAICDTLEEMGVTQVAVYGVGLGAAVGLALSSAAAEGLSVSLNLVDAGGAVPLLPDLSPEEDGGHLLRLWDELLELRRKHPKPLSIARGGGPGEREVDLEAVQRQALDWLVVRQHLTAWQDILRDFDWDARISGCRDIAERISWRTPPTDDSGAVSRPLPQSENRP
ncbi:MAG: alpha/beta fold hydrolase [Gammaproteobacteria bacterium AqS3]|nr:alpha/beta fold hydrolase [Gammaproteobacteria bacterium AqS3]